MGPGPKDSADRAYTIKIATWSLIGGVLGSAGAFMAGIPLWIGFLIGFVACFAVSSTIVNSAATLASKIHNPSGSSTPARREYSRARAHAKAGQYDDALGMWEFHATEYPDDPEPCIEAARICRDHLRDYPEAVRWFKRAQGCEALSPGMDVLITEELVEIYMGKLNEPNRALPELARSAERHAGTEAGRSARQRLEWLRRELFSGDVT